MSETTQSTVEDFEKEFETVGTDGDHISGRPGKGDDRDLAVKDDHSPIGPEAGVDGGVVTMDDHSPIGAESVKDESPGKGK
ncbi:hypothetical protein AN219_07005 [Streptomyces nanshensis]|nr:hypothetical protein AN219_07005 [Streptomyces nanshensis]